MNTVQQNTQMHSPRRRDAALLVAWSDERDQWEKIALDYARDMYHAGHADGYKDGYEACGHHLDQAWNTAARPFRNSHRPDHAALEARRWGPGGRKHFGDPRPADYTGKG